MIEVHTDGATSGNPGISGAGIYIKVGKQTASYSLPLGTMTNHEAEFHAVLRAMQICAEKYPDDIIWLQSDSQVVIDAIEREHIKNKQYQPLLAAILEEIKIFPQFFCKWIPSAQNFHADRLAKQAIQQQT